VSIHPVRLTAAVALIVGLWPAAGAVADTNLLPNGGFEGSGSGSLAGWHGSDAVLGLAGDGEGGGFAAAVAFSGVGPSFNVRAAPRPVGSTVSGTFYVAGGSVRSDVPGEKVCLKLAEYSSTGANVGGSQKCVTAGSVWAAFPLESYTTQQSGGTLGFTVVRPGAVGGDSFEVDNLSLAVSTADMQPPTTPQNLSATPVGSSEIDLSWAASTDDVGVTGYTIYRGGAQLTTVGGTATSFADTSVKPSTTYTYTVDAFDAAGNHSPQSGSASATTTSASDPCGQLSGGPPATYSHVVVIMEENASYGSVIGNVNAPYLNAVAQECALATDYHEDAGVSQPNYMAATGGFATGVGVFDHTASIFSQVPSWLELEESMGANCGGSGTFYKTGHDPAYWYTPLASACKTYDVSMKAADSGATGIPSQLPAYTWITPNLCHDHHWLTGCPEADTAPAILKAMGVWLSGTVEQITSTADYQMGRTLILVTFDEGTTDTRVATIAMSAAVQPVRDGAPYDHYALLRATENSLGISTFLGNAATAGDMRAGMGF
jgi:Fibronectin type III domain